MTSKHLSRSLFRYLRPTRRRPSPQQSPTDRCLSHSPSNAPSRFSRPRPFSTNSSSLTPEMEVEGKPRPRWSYTPPAMTAPVRSNPKPRPVRLSDCNADPKRLDAFYRRMLGTGGDRMLSEETKWLAVTHKSFDHGRRGFNERLAFLGAQPSEEHSEKSRFANFADSILRETYHRASSFPWAAPEIRSTSAIRGPIRTKACTTSCPCRPRILG